MGIERVTALLRDYSSLQKIRSRKIRFTLLASVLVWLIASLTCAETALAYSEAEWDMLQRAAVNALDTNRYWLAEPMLKKSVKEAEKFGFDSWRLSTALHELGRYYTIRGRFKEAEPCFEKELQVREMTVGKEADQIIPAMGSLVRFYLSYGSAEKADSLSESMLALLEGKMKDTKVHAASFKKGQPIEAWLGTASLHRDPVLEWSITCDTIGKCYRARGNLKLAEKLFKASLDMKTSILGLGHLSLASTYAELGLLYMENELYQEAEPCFREAYNSTVLVLPPESTEVFAQLERLARCLTKQQKFEEAEQLYSKALKDLKKRELSGGDEAKAMYALGCLYIEQKNFSQAAYALARAIDMNERFNGSCQIGLVPYLEKYAYCLYYLGRRGDTDRLRARAEQIMGPELVAERNRERAKIQEEEASKHPPQEKKIKQTPPLHKGRVKHVAKRKSATPRSAARFHRKVRK